MVVASLRRMSGDLVVWVISLVLEHEFSKKLNGPVLLRLVASV